MGASPLRSNHARPDADAGSPGMMVVISGPSGVGKSTVVRELLERIPGACFSVSATTRPPTRVDRPGKDYHFLSAEKFQSHVDAGNFLEHAVYAGNRYGTLIAPVREQLAQSRIVILDIDVQGGVQIHNKMRDALAIFILPPSNDALLERLRSRKRESEEIIQMRYREARWEIEQAHSSGAYDEFVINDDLKRAIAEIESIVAKEQTRRAQLNTG